MGWTSEVRIHVGAPLCVIRRLRKRFTHKGFVNFHTDFRGNPDYNEALNSFAAHAVERNVQSAGGGVGKDAHGELVYDFSIWKDNVCEVALHFLLLLEKTLADELGKTWRNVAGLSSPRNFARAWSELGHGEEMCFDMMPALIHARGDAKLLYDGSMDGLLMDLFIGSEPTAGLPYPSLHGFQSFTSELAAAHTECEPDAFRCDNGGLGSKVRLRGLEKKPELNGKLGLIADPVDLETRRWPVRLAATGGSKEQPLISVRRQNLELVDLHIPEDTTFRNVVLPQANVGEFLDGLRGGFLGKGAPAPTTPPAWGGCSPAAGGRRGDVFGTGIPTPAKQQRSRQSDAAAGGGAPTCCFWLQGKCRFGSQCRNAHCTNPTSMCQFGRTCRVGHGQGKPFGTKGRGYPPFGPAGTGFPNTPRVQEDSGDSESGNEDDSMYGFGGGMCGFSGAECDELLMQGIKPWDDDADAAAAVLFGGDGYDDYF